MARAQPHEHTQPLTVYPNPGDHLSSSLSDHHFPPALSTYNDDIMASSELVLLPAEILALVVSHLPNSDVKSLRLTCKRLHANTKLRLDRVFLSANPRDVEVFRAVADDDTFCHSIVEIIWDDAVIQDTAREDEGTEYNVYEADEDENEEYPGVPRGSRGPAKRTTSSSGAATWTTSWIAPSALFLRSFRSARRGSGSRNGTASNVV